MGESGREGGVCGGVTSQLLTNHTALAPASSTHVEVESPPTKLLHTSSRHMYTLLNLPTLLKSQ